MAELPHPVTQRQPPRHPALLASCFRRSHPLPWPRLLLTWLLLLSCSHMPVLLGAGAACVAWGTSGEYLRDPGLPRPDGPFSYARHLGVGSWSPPTHYWCQSRIPWDTTTRPPPWRRYCSLLLRTPHPTFLFSLVVILRAVSSMCYVLVVTWLLFGQIYWCVCLIWIRLKLFLLDYDGVDINLVLF